MNTNRISLVIGQSFGRGFVHGHRRNIIQNDYRGETAELMLQRQGCSTKVNCSHPAFHVEIYEYQSKHWVAEVFYSNDQSRYGFTFAGQRIGRKDNFSSREGATIAAAEIIDKEFGLKVTFSEHTMAYMFGNNTYGYQKDDVLVSPVHFDPERRAIVHTEYNQILVGFYAVEQPSAESTEVAIRNRFIPFIRTKNPSFLEMVKGSIANVDRVGHHDCDFKRGADYCMRRYAWLLGSYMMNYEREVIGCNAGAFYIVGGNMELRK